MLAAIRQPRLKLPHVPDRIEKAIDVIDAQAGHLPFGDQLQRAAVARFEDFRILHAHADEIGDVEKPSIVDLLAGDAPVRQPVPLPIEEIVERVEALGVSLLAVQALDGVIERLAKSRVLLVDPPERLLEELAVGNRRVSLHQLAQLHPHALLG